MEMQLTARYSLLDLKTKCQPVNKSVICSKGQALSLKAKFELSVPVNFLAPSSKLTKNSYLKVFRVLFLASANNKTPKVTTQKALGTLVWRYVEKTSNL